MKQTLGATLFEMYNTLLDRAGVNEADEWRSHLKPLQQAHLARYEKMVTDDDGIEKKINIYELV